MSYSSNDISGQKYLEQYHSHPVGQGCITSLADLKALALAYVNGHITSVNFTYGVVSEAGCLTLVITSMSDFGAFASKIRSGDYDTKWGSTVSGIPVGTFDGSIEKLINFLDSSISGLSVTFRSMSIKNKGNHMENWSAKELDENKKIINSNCK